MDEVDGTNKDKNNLSSIEYFSMGIQKQSIQEIDLETKRSLRRLRTEAESKLGFQGIVAEETVSMHSKCEIRNFYRDRQ